MSETIFPNSRKAIPHTNQERAEREKQTKQSFGQNVAIDDPEDEIGAEMARGARVWRTYVKETDRSDKEMVEGRNRQASLDVLLIFAALFSAISTAFIIESLGDLKPDPAESSAKTLLAISQKLDAIVSGQQASSSSAQTSNNDLDVFSPSHSAVVVNILWLLSLSLSVAVSLIAMLAKDWCYSFMSGRSGQVYDQARKRQQRWNGIERWKMQELVTQLPGLLHLALLLFAIGLCIYLWDINLPVAIPVTMVTSLAALIYILATVLPMVDAFCPYSTPATIPVRITCKAVWLVAQWGLFFASIAIVLFLRLISFKSERLNEHTRRFMEWVQPGGKNEINDEQEALMDSVPMDHVTSMMLAWMIANCEDSRSVDVALQAIAGGRIGLPCDQLLRVGALKLVRARFMGLVDVKATAVERTLKNENMLDMALRYSRASGVLLCHVSPRLLEAPWIREGCYMHQEHELSGCQYRCVQYLQYATYGPSAIAEAGTFNSLVNSTLVTSGDPKRVAAALIGLFYSTGAGRVSMADDMALSTLRQHACGTHLISNRILIALLESFSYYSLRTGISLASALLDVLACIYLKAESDAPEVARVVAVTLAAQTFLANFYPGGEVAPGLGYAKLKRALEVFDYHRTHHITEHHRHFLFTFSMIGLLPHADLTVLNQHASLTSTFFEAFMNLDLDLEVHPIHTLPPSYSLDVHLRDSHQLSIRPHTYKPTIPGYFSNRTLKYSMLLKARLRTHRLFIPALLLIRFTEFSELQDAYIQSLSLLPVGGHIDLYSHSDLMDTLIQAPPHVDAVIVSVVTFYLRVLIAAVMLSDDCVLSERQDVLKSIFKDRAEFSQLGSNNDCTPVSQERIFDHVEEDTSGQSGDECMHHTVRLVFDFCSAGLAHGLVHETEAIGSQEPPAWQKKLQRIRERFGSHGFRPRRFIPEPESETVRPTEPKPSAETDQIQDLANPEGETSMEESPGHT